MNREYRAKFGLDQFELYNLARAFRGKVYKLLRALPAQEKYCLVPQMRRAAISVSNNIAEGHGRWHFQENIQFCRIARGSVEEVIDDINICLDEHYGDPTSLHELTRDAEVLVARINSYINYLKKSKQSDD